MANFTPITYNNGIETSLTQLREEFWCSSLLVFIDQPKNSTKRLLLNTNIDTVHHAEG